MHKQYLLEYKSKENLRCENTYKEYKKDIGVKNLIKGKFKAKKPNSKWFIDESFIKLPRRKWAYLCAVIDTYNNEIIAWKISDYRDQELALEVIDIAIKNRKVNKLIIHSDRGAIYCSDEYQKLLKENGIKQSMNDKPISTQNRPIEYFFSVYKCEYLRFMNILHRSIESLNNETLKWIEHYNYKRIQLCLGTFTPMEFKK